MDCRGGSGWGTVDRLVGLVIESFREIGKFVLVVYTNDVKFYEFLIFYCKYLQGCKF